MELLALLNLVSLFLDWGIYSIPSIKEVAIWAWVYQLLVISWSREIRRLVQNKYGAQSLGYVLFDMFQRAIPNNINICSSLWKVSSYSTVVLYGFSVILLLRSGQPGPMATVLLEQFFSKVISVIELTTWFAAIQSFYLLWHIVFIIIFAASTLVTWRGLKLHALIVLLALSYTSGYPVYAKTVFMVMLTVCYLVDFINQLLDLPVYPGRRSLFEFPYPVYLISQVFAVLLGLMIYYIQSPVGLVGQLIAVVYVGLSFALVHLSIPFYGKTRQLIRWVQSKRDGELK